MAESAPTPPPAEPPKPVFVSCDEVSVTVKCWENSSTNPDPAVSYRIEYKEYPEVLLSPAAAWRARPFTNHTRYPFARQDWNDAKSIDVVPKPGAPIDVTCIDLKPLMTYNIRLVAIAKNGEGNDQLTTPGPDAIIDTAATGCTPKPKRRCIIS